MSTTASTILVVEDDAIVRMLIVDVLEELEFNVLEAGDAEEALALVQDTDQVIDLMMTDVACRTWTASNWLPRSANCVQPCRFFSPAAMRRTSTCPPACR